MMISFEDKSNMYIPYDKKEKIRIIFMIQVASFWPSIESFYEACKNDNRFDVKLVYIDESSVEKVQMKNTVDFLNTNNLEYEIFDEKKILEYKPHIAIYQPPYDVSYRNPNALSIHLKKMGIRIVYIPYGIEISDTDDARLAHFDTFVVRNSWRIYTSSDAMKLEYEKYCRNRFAVKALGLPKFDSYHNKKYEPLDEVTSRSKGRKTILWKMHFPKKIYDNGDFFQVTPSIDEYIKFGKEIINYKDLFFIVMPHPMFYSNSIPSDLAEKAKKMLYSIEKYENVYIDKSDDYRVSLCNVDAIIVDRSALMVEAGVQNTPILYMYNKDYQEPLTPPIKTLIETYDTGTSFEDMQKFISQIVKNKKANLTSRKEIIQKFISKIDGKNGNRIKEDIYENLEKQENTKIRLILFATGLVCEHYIKYLNLINDNRFQILAFSDNSNKKWGEELYNIKIVPPDKLKEIDFDLLIIMTEQYHMEIKKKLVYDVFLDDEKIIRLDYFCEKYFSGNDMNYVEEQEYDIKKY